jgi:hypothetical protein
MEPGGAPWPQIAADTGSPKKEYFRFPFYHHVADHLGIGIGGVVFEKRRLADQYLIRAVTAQLLCEIRNLVPQKKAAYFSAKIVRQLPRFGYQFKIGGHEPAVPLFTEYPQALKIVYFPAIVIRHY